MYIGLQSYKVTTCAVSGRELLEKKPMWLQ